ncbi:Carbohydrate sulfotransferase 14-like 2, partial [Homarus americanus]
MAANTVTILQRTRWTFRIWVFFSLGPILTLCNILLYLNASYSTFPVPPGNSSVISASLGKSPGAIKTKPDVAVNPDHLTDFLEVEELMPSPSRFTEVAKSNEFSRILVVRHPLERLVSAYRNRLADPDIIGYQSQTYVPLILAYTRGRSYSHKEIFNVAGRIQVIPTFKEFVSFLVEEEIQEYDDHWTPISYTCGLCYINYTAIIHTETYQDDIRYIMSRPNTQFSYHSPISFFLLSPPPDRISGLDTKVNPELMNNYTNKANGHDTQDV